ncbi:MAG: hypothetical protein HC898_08380 [Phycisphaerales bacterium]|nr:hypothetical protein [Phycisphaerales bacterium]
MIGDLNHAQNVTRPNAANDRQKLMAQRAKLQGVVDATQARIDEIDAIFSGSGLSVAASGKGKPGPKAGSTRGKRTRGKFSMTGDESVVSFIKKHGKPSAKEVNEHWTKEGRGGSANNALTKLVKTGVIKRVDAEDARGGRYVIA